jgi:hypothetical protein
LVASYDGATWLTLDAHADVSGYTAAGLKFALPEEGAAPAERTFAFFRLCIEQTNGETWLSIADLSLFGTPA